MLNICPEFASDLERIKKQPTKKQNDVESHPFKFDPSDPLGIEFLYLMKNCRDGRYKIGRSMNPIHREKTLQSEEPDVKLVAKFKGLARYERDWHDYFSDQHCRGEWFDLTGVQVKFMVHKCRLNRKPPKRNLI